MKTQTLKWNFPLPEPGTGVFMGNGTLGLMVWGNDRLCLSISRNGFWDRRGGAVPSAGATFAELKRLLQAGETEAAGKLFTSPKPKSHYGKPTQLPCARLELVAEGWTPEEGELDLPSGVLTVFLKNEKGDRAGVRIQVARDTEFAWMECDAALGAVSVVPVPMWNYLGDRLAADGCLPPTVWEEPAGGGVLQTLPEDPAMALAWEWRERTLGMATALGAEPTAEARSRAGVTEISAISVRTAAWWQAYWADMPKLTLPEAEIEHIYLYGVYQQAGLTPAEGVPASLVGPWMQEDMFPAWRNDFHFNINLQMIYWPALATNRTDHLWPLWRMILSWMPLLRANATNFFQVENAVMLPHAVNDQGKTVDNFWSGMIDHGCTAWMAQLAWLHYRYSMDEQVLREVAWPLLVGTFNGYWAMAEELPDGKGGIRLSLPITVSPEYSGLDSGTWGRDASFQLAAWHMISAILPQAAALLGEPEDSRWERVRRELPPYATIEGGDVWNRVNPVSRMAVWEGQDLDESHRHHSHLAAIYPFGSIDPGAPEHRLTLTHTLQHWVSRGTGMWSGWSLPWAATLASHYDAPDATIAWLRWWRNIYTNVGYGSDHNGDFLGCTVLNRGYFFPEDPDQRYTPTIQLDGSLGAVTAVLELMVQSRLDTLFVLPRVPRRWRNFSFEGIRAEGAFLVSAVVEGGKVIETRVTSLAGAPLKLSPGLGEKWEWDGQIHHGSLLETPTTSGQKLILKRL